MTGVEDALEAAILEVIGADDGVKAYLGDAVRIVGSGTPRPMFPYLEVVRHQSEPAGGTDADLTVHRIDLQVVSRRAESVEAKAAMAAVRTAVMSAELEMEGWACILLAPVFMDAVRRHAGEWRAMMRLKAIVEPA